jgi:hypothetical protein
VLQLLLEQVEHPDDPEDDEKLPLLLKLHADIFRFTFLLSQAGHDMSLSFPITRYSNSFLHFMHLYSYMGMCYILLK